MVYRFGDAESRHTKGQIQCAAHMIRHNLLMYSCPWTTAERHEWLWHEIGQLKRGSLKAVYDDPRGEATIAMCWVHEAGRLTFYVGCRHSPDLECETIDDLHEEEPPSPQEVPFYFLDGVSRDWVRVSPWPENIPPEFISAVAFRLFDAGDDFERLLQYGELRLRQRFANDPLGKIVALPNIVLAQRGDREA